MKPRRPPFFSVLGVVAVSPAAGAGVDSSAGSSDVAAGVSAVSTGAVTAAVSIGLFSIGSSILGAVSETGGTSLSLLAEASFSDFSVVGLETRFLKRLPKTEARLPFFSVGEVSSFSSFLSETAAAGTVVIR